MLGTCVDGHVIMSYNDGKGHCVGNVIIRYIDVIRILHHIFGYNSCVRAYNISPHGRLLDNDTFYHLVSNLNLSEAIYSCAKSDF